MTLSIVEQAKEVIHTEILAIERMLGHLTDSFEKAIQIILQAKGRVVILGMGKSGIIGQKIAATLASTGTAAFFVHPGEAFHGDLGMIKPEDVALLISNSGETEEVVRILPFLEYQQNKVIVMTGNIDSTLAHHADVVLDVSVDREACNINLAPTSSTTCTLVMGDALAVVLSSEKGFQPEDFARFHPGGNLGRRLLTRVADVMRKHKLPICDQNTSFKEVVKIINNAFLGLTLVMQDKKLLGIITDGDIRRAFDSHDNFKTLTAKDIMTRNPKVIYPDVRFGEAEAYMHSLKISSLVVVDKNQDVIGILRIYDLEHEGRT